jgi:hypothetical protein
MIKKFLFLFFLIVKIFPPLLSDDDINSHEISAYENHDQDASSDENQDINTPTIYQQPSFLRTTKDKFITVLSPNVKDAKSQELIELNKKKKEEKQRKEITDTLKQKKGPLYFFLGVLLAVVFFFPIKNLYYDYKYYLLKRKIMQQPEIQLYVKKNTNKNILYDNTMVDEEKFIKTYSLIQEVAENG